MKDASAPTQGAPPRLTAGIVCGVLWGALFEAFFVSLMILIVGSVALGMTSGILKGMLPDLPALSSSPEPETAVASSAPGPFRKYVAQHKFALIYCFTYAGLVLSQLGRYSQNPGERRLVSRLKKAARKVSEKWFEVLFLNAIAAVVGAALMTAAQQFSKISIAVHALLAVLHPFIYWVAELFFDAGQIATIQGFIQWFDANQMKFLFWMLYLSAVLDDLGLPNLKTLAKRGWKRIKAGGAASRPNRKAPNREEEQAHN